jgi:hypothetical protein
MSGADASATVDAMGSQALKVNKWGESETLQAAGGRFTVGLRGATANSNSGDRTDYVVGGEPVILVERTDGNMAAAYRSLDEIPVPGPVQIAETTAGDPAPNTQPRRVQTSSKEKATPTPTPKKR